MPIMKWLLAFLTVVNPSNAADAVSPIFKLTLLFGACVWVAVTVAIIIWAAYSFSIGNFSTVAPLKFLRATARLTATALFVPFATIFISVYKCKAHYTWSVTNWECYVSSCDGRHALQSRVDHHARVPGYPAAGSGTLGNAGAGVASAAVLLCVHGMLRRCVRGAGPQRQ